MTIKTKHILVPLVLGLALLLLALGLLNTPTRQTMASSPSALQVSKSASADRVSPGERLTYTLRVTNTGTGDLHAHITDTLPMGIAPGRTAAGTAFLPGGQITWAPVITAPGGVWMETVIVTTVTTVTTVTAVTAAEGPTGPLVNRVEVTTQEGAAGADSVTTPIGWQVHLPLALRNYSAACTGHTAAFALSAPTTTVQVGNLVTVTATLTNAGCSMLGLPQYRLTIQPAGGFDPAKPDPVTHTLGLEPGQSDAADFALRAIAPGTATLAGSVSFEVHLGYPGPAYWSVATAAPLTMTIQPAH